MQLSRFDEIVLGRFKMTVLGYLGDRIRVMNKQGETFTLSPKQTINLENKYL